MSKHAVRKHSTIQDVTPLSLSALALARAERYPGAGDYQCNQKHNGKPVLNSKRALGRRDQREAANEKSAGSCVGNPGRSLKLLRLRVDEKCK